MNDLFGPNIKKYNKTVTVYNLPLDFIIEADKDEEVTHFYIYHKNYGIKMLMFSLCNHDILEQDDIVEVNAVEYMTIYKNEYMD